MADSEFMSDAHFELDNPQSDSLVNCYILYLFRTGWCAGGRQGLLLSLQGCRAVLLDEGWRFCTTCPAFLS